MKVYTVAIVFNFSTNHDLSLPIGLGAFRNIMLPASARDENHFAEKQKIKAFLYDMPTI